MLERINAADVNAPKSRVLGDRGCFEATMWIDAVTAEAESACHAAKAAIIDVESRHRNCVDRTGAFAT